MLNITEVENASILLKWHACVLGNCVSIHISTAVEILRSVFVEWTVLDTMTCVELPWLAIGRWVLGDLRAQWVVFSYQHLSDQNLKAVKDIKKHMIRYCLFFQEKIIKVSQIIITNQHRIFCCEIYSNIKMKKIQKRINEMYVKTQWKTWIFVDKRNLPAIGAGISNCSDKLRSSEECSKTWRQWCQVESHRISENDIVTCVELAWITIGPVGGQVDT